MEVPKELALSIMKVVSDHNDRNPDNLVWIGAIIAGPDNFRTLFEGYIRDDRAVVCGTKLLATILQVTGDKEPHIDPELAVTQH